MASPQTGIFALGTASHAYLELDATGDARALAPAVASLREPRTTMGGVNLVAGFRPELWRELRPEDTPRDAAGFDADLVGIEGFVMPATQHDAVLWISGPGYDVVFDAARTAIDVLSAVATVAEETSSWSYHHDLDLTGFIDGPERAGRKPTASSSIRGPTTRRRENRPGHLRQDPPPQHGVRHGHRPRHGVRRLRRRAGAAAGDAREHGRTEDRRARRADPLHEAGDRRLLRHPSVESIAALAGDALG